MDPVSRLGLAIAMVLAVAKLGGELAVRLGQPSVLGELVGGIALGSLPWHAVEALRTDPSLDMLARLGVLVLLFEVGLESTVREVAQVGVAAGRVALLGTLGTLLAGWGAATVAMPQAGLRVHLFAAAAITATSIGISARVLKDAGAARTVEARTILGAAILDDVLGLVALAVVTGALATGEPGAVGPARIVRLVAGTLGFLVVAVVAGSTLTPVLFRATARLRTRGVLLATGLSLCFALSWASSAMGLAPIVGAFTAGLVLEESHSARFVARGEPSLATQLEPIASWLVPIFFVLMGTRANLGALASPHTLLLVTLLAAAAIVGKLACALGAPRGADGLTIALGMLPRGEVSLVFASLGLTMGLLDAAQYSALVTVVVVTTLVAPAALRGRLRARPAQA